MGQSSSHRCTTTSSLSFCDWDARHIQELEEFDYEIPGAQRSRFASSESQFFLVGGGGIRDSWIKLLHSAQATYKPK